MKIAKDHPATQEFALQTGKLIQNFGVVELASYQWIGVLSGSMVAVEIATEVPLAERIKILIRLLSRDHATLTPVVRGQAAKLWKQIQEKGCPLRNAIAHGAMGLSFPNDDFAAEPALSGVLRVRRNSDVDELVSLEELTDAVNTTARIVEALHDLLTSCGVGTASVHDVTTTTHRNAL